MHREKQTQKYGTEEMYFHYLTNKEELSVFLDAGYCF